VATNAISTVLLLGLLILGARNEEFLVIPGGEYTPLYTLGEKRVTVQPFLLATFPVTNGQYLDFVRDNPKWRRSQFKRVFAEESYLSHWTGDLLFDPELADRPVVNVSWFAARAFCQARGGRLPTQDEWEFTARATETATDGTTDVEFRQRILNWYSRPTPKQFPAVGTTFKNVYGIHDMHGLAWEWVDDFNSILVTGESRGDDGVDRDLYCAAGVSGSTDPGDYAAYMRYAFRSSLKSSYTTGNLGFRCAADKPAKKRKTL
jgi:formylglycine-generating enzyme required for sulfatase activity